MSVKIVSPQEFNTLQTTLTEGFFGIHWDSSALNNEHRNLVNMEYDNQTSPRLKEIEDWYVRRYMMYYRDLKFPALNKEERVHVKAHIEDRISKSLRGMKREEIVRIWQTLSKERKGFFAGKHIELTLKLDYATKHPDKYKFFADKRGQTHLQNTKTGKFTRIKVANTGRVMIGGRAKAKGRRRSK